MIGDKNITTNGNTIVVAQFLFVEKELSVLCFGS